MADARGSFSDTQLFRLLATHVDAQGGDLSDPAAVVGLTESLGSMVSAAVSNPIVKYGVHAEALFEWTVRVLGSCRLVQRLDGGDSILVDAVESPSPDFLVVTEKGARLVVEVKNHGGRKGGNSKRFKRAYLERLSTYSELLDARPMLAIYWSAWNLWSLVDVGFLLTTNDTQAISLDMTDALAESEMSVLGDLLVIARANRMVFGLDVDILGGSPTDHGEELSLRISAVEILFDEDAVADTTESSIAWFLMLFGGVEPANEFTRNSDEAGRIEFIFEDEDGDGVYYGYLSSMLARLYSSQSGNDDGEVVSLPFPELGTDHPSRLLANGYQGETVSFVYGVVKPRRSARD